ncbi:S8 family peptidase [Helicobacter mesocricetorum]|uniref:S8 family peptidase n=1 Tax=Helicobacter mesocricetorum TaxID=87012 RepID=UPI000CF15CB1|nr:S8 family peptidase [Helicobacter mesocricetorum]
MFRFIILWIASFATIFADDLVNSKAFNLINAQDAYKQGITGKGVNVGVVDSAINKNHISLRNKVGKELTSNLSNNGHGTHVGGIIAGERLDNTKPYGVAYNSMLYSRQIFGGPILPLGDFFTKNGVKIINNSWNTIDINYAKHSNKDSNYFLRQASGRFYSKELYDLAQKNQTLLVFASGNQGIISSGVFSILPTFDENLRSIINIGALNADGVFRDGNKLRITSQGAPTFSNSFLKSENYSLMAFGVSINSADGANVNGYRKATGTSMAAPMVSGAAALVAQKFPFLNGKQIADILLSTANKDYQAPKLVVKKSYQNGNKFSIAYIDNAPPPR